MALRSGLLRVNLLVNRCGLSRFPSSVGLRSVSDKTSSKAATAGDPETTDDHLIYTREHLALKESLSKVCKKEKETASIEANDASKYIFVYIFVRAAAFSWILQITRVFLSC